MGDKTASGSDLDQQRRGMSILHSFPGLGLVRRQAKAFQRAEADR